MKSFRIRQIFSSIFVFIFCFIACLIPNVSRASEPNESIKGEKEIQESNLFLKKHSLEIGSELYHFEYREPGGITDKGVFYGGVLNYTYRGWISDSLNESLSEGGGALHAELRFATGEADYDGSLNDGTPYKVNNIEYNAYEARFLCSMDYLDEEWIASLSAGIGFRYSHDDSSFDPYGYERESNYLYLPISYQLDTKFVNNWSYGFTMEADFLIQGLQKSHLSDVGDVDIENEQYDGLGFRASFKLQKRINTGVLIFEPFIRYWSIEESEHEYIPPYIYYEPKNSTTEIGLQIKWEY